MNSTRWNSILLALFLLTATAFYLAGMAGVPFHPDESTQLFMSSDLQALFQEPSSLFWKPGQENDLRQNYRLLDAPLTRDLIGIGRFLSRTPALPSDWNWSETWQQNQARGALPDSRLLWVGRISVAWLFPFSLLLIYLCGSRLGGKWTGWIAALLLATNAIILLHTRRAMAESALVFTSLLALWALLVFRRWAWLSAVPIAFAFAAKQQAAALLLPGMIAVLWQGNTGAPVRRRWVYPIYFGLIFTGITLAMNPFLWGSPLSAAQAALQARAEFTRVQVGTFNAAGQATLDTVPLRAVGMIAQLYFTSPAIAEAGNYRLQTQAAEADYLANPLHRLLRSLPGGALLLSLTLLGVVLGFIMAIRNTTPPHARRGIALLLTATMAQLAVMVLLVPLPFQRYAVVLVPYTCLWIGFGLRQIASAVILRLR